MNERIKELLKQAEERYPRHLAVAVPEVVLRQDALEKFAELIVAECVQVVDDMADPKENSDRYFWAIQNASQKIKQHFGVEE